eukprot:c20070_g1_i1.p1 GENE.c20070_g1_i1~~c20070_g1_i1.p1  ORF type:complete len:542 (+),score=188.25 c20070_g1_i1:333-1958(+)
MIEFLFEKAVSEPNFVGLYAQLCELIQKSARIFIVEAKEMDFRRLLLSKCQSIFESFFQVDNDEDEDETKKVEISEEQALKQKRIIFGNIRFIGELYIRRLISEKIMHICVDRLFSSYDDDHEEEDIEATCKLLTTIGKTLDQNSTTKEDGDKRTGYYEKLVELEKDTSLSQRIRFMILDLLDLRKRNWADKPKTIPQPEKEDNSKSTKASPVTRPEPVSPSQDARKQPVKESDDQGWTDVQQKKSKKESNKKSDQIDSTRTPTKQTPVKTVQESPRINNKTTSKDAPTPQPMFSKSKFSAFDNLDGSDEDIEAPPEIFTPQKKTKQQPQQPQTPQPKPNKKAEKTPKKKEETQKVEKVEEDTTNKKTTITAAQTKGMVNEYFQLKNQEDLKFYLSEYTSSVYPSFVNLALQTCLVDQNFGSAKSIEFIYATELPVPNILSGTKQFFEKYEDLVTDNPNLSRDLAEFVAAMLAKQMFKPSDLFNLLSPLSGTTHAASVLKRILEDLTKNHSDFSLPEKSIQLPELSVDDLEKLEAFKHLFI